MCERGPPARPTFRRGNLFVGGRSSSAATGGGRGGARSAVSPRASRSAYVPFSKNSLPIGHFAPQIARIWRRSRRNMRDLAKRRKFFGIADFLASHFRRKRYGIFTRQGCLIAVAKENRRRKYCAQGKTDGVFYPAARQRADARLDLWPDRNRLLNGLRHYRHDQFCSWRRSRACRWRSHCSS